MAHQLEPIAENLDIDMSEEADGHMQKCINAAFNRDPLFLKYLDKPGMIELAEAIHGNDCHIVSMHTWLVGPGRSASPCRLATLRGARGNFLGSAGSDAYLHHYT